MAQEPRTHWLNCPALLGWPDAASAECMCEWIDRAVERMSRDKERRYALGLPPIVYYLDPERERLEAKAYQAAFARE